MRPFALLFVFLALVAAGDAPADAQDATPGAALPVAPDPAECTVEPRPHSDFEALVGTPAPATPATFDPPRGEPADAETIAAVTATVRAALACANGLDFSRFAALYTDVGFREDFADPSGDDLAFLLATPQAVPEEERVTLTDVRDVVVLDDGRVGAVVVYSEPGEGEQGDYLIFAEEDGRYLIDLFVDEYDVPATPAAGTPAPSPIAGDHDPTRRAARDVLAVG
ncbi:MAG: hypothetical protein M3Q10_09925 [Chloroflexota bacterium]|nr:hypothetical protein [Chloroflexota bacterium]